MVCIEQHVCVCMCTFVSVCSYTLHFSFWTSQVLYFLLKEHTFILTCHMFFSSVGSWNHKIMFLNCFNFADCAVCTAYKPYLNLRCYLFKKLPKFLLVNTKNWLPSQKWLISCIMFHYKFNPLFTFYFMLWLAFLCVSQLCIYCILAAGDRYSCGSFFKKGWEWFVERFMK